MKATIGRIVHYKVASHDTDLVSNGVNIGNLLPAIIVRVWDADVGYVNLHVFADGHTFAWKTSIYKGDGEGQWNWPDRV